MKLNLFSFEQYYSTHTFTPTTHIDYNFKNIFENFDTASSQEFVNL